MHGLLCTLEAHAYGTQNVTGVCIQYNRKLILTIDYVLT